MLAHGERPATARSGPGAGPREPGEDRKSWSSGRSRRATGNTSPAHGAPEHDGGSGTTAAPAGTQDNGGMCPMTTGSRAVALSTEGRARKPDSQGVEPGGRTPQSVSVRGGGRGQVSLILQEHDARAYPPLGRCWGGQVGVGEACPAPSTGMRFLLGSPTLGSRTLGPWKHRTGRSPGRSGSTGAAGREDGSTPARHTERRGQGVPGHTEGGRPGGRAP